MTRMTTVLVYVTVPWSQFRLAVTQAGLREMKKKTQLDEGTREMEHKALYKLRAAGGVAQLRVLPTFVKFQQLLLSAKWAKIQLATKTELTSQTVTVM